MISIKDRMAAETAVEANRRRDLARADAGEKVDKPVFPKNKTRLPTTEEQKGVRSYAPASGGFMASRALAKAGGGKAGRPAAHGHSRHK
jgi:hypothetical protein